MKSRKALLRSFISTIPSVKKELDSWTTLAKDLSEPLRTQALLSIEHKTFHCIGGSVYAHYPQVDLKIMLSLIVAFQTISDYLDNLCDRLHVTNDKAFRTLHQSFLHALNPAAPIENYYAFYPYQEDFYLRSLVQTCQNLLNQIPHYEEFKPYAMDLAYHYCELQVLKHVKPHGNILLQEWTEKEFDSMLEWNEWAAASGSTLGIFYLFALSFHAPEKDLKHALTAYFPWIQGLHILLDYLIDSAEDAKFDDLNFIAYYPSELIRDISLQKFSKESKLRARELSHPLFHRTVVDGLLALYGSDPKVAEQKQTKIIKLMAEDKTTLLMLKLCRLLRFAKIL